MYDDYVEHMYVINNDVPEVFDLTPYEINNMNLTLVKTSENEAPIIVLGQGYRGEICQPYSHLTIKYSGTEWIEIMKDE